MRLHDYWRSSAAYRVRIALNYKGLGYTSVPHDLRRGQQRDAAYLARNPQGFVPMLELGDAALIQSWAILEWLEAAHPSPALLPPAPLDAAIVRGMAGLIACDIHPLNNLRVLNALRSDFDASEAQVSAWTARWICDGFAALELMIDRHGKRFAFGDQPSFADCHLVPQVYSAERFGLDLTPFPRLVQAVSAARALPAFALAHPDRQPDADSA
jgi:maleylpyruvate isomerase